MLPARASRGGTTLAAVFRQPFYAQYMSDFGKKWPVGFRPAPIITNALILTDARPSRTR